MRLKNFGKNKRIDPDAPHIGGNILCNRLCRLVCRSLRFKKSLWNKKVGVSHYIKTTL